MLDLKCIFFFLLLNYDYHYYLPNRPLLEGRWGYIALNTLVNVVFVSSTQGPENHYSAMSDSL